jgi:hypothetical protein
VFVTISCLRPVLDVVVPSRQIVCNSLLNWFILRLGNFAEKEQDRIEFHEISSNVLEKVIQYFYYKQKYHASTGEIPEFPIEPEIALELLMAANFLDA